MATKWLLLCALLVVAHAVQDIYLSGSFVTSIVQDDGSVRHASGILAYDPDTDEFVDKFNGGVYVNVGTITLLKETVLGIIGAGHFRYVDDGFGYSSAVLYYDGDEDDFAGLNDGIWLGTGDSVRYIASVNSDVVFAGTFSTVESISAENFDNDDSDTVVPGIIKMNSDKEYSLLNDPDNVFPHNKTDSIQGLTQSEDGETLYIYSVNRGIYSWDNDDYYQLLVPATNLTHNTLTVDANGNLYGVVRSSIGNSGGSGLTYTYYLAVFNAAAGYSGNYYEFVELNTQLCQTSVTGAATTVLLTAWNDGILISYPDYSDCTSTIFAYYNTTTSEIQANFTAVPSGPFDISSITLGKNDDIWVIPYSTIDTAASEADYIYYYKTGSSNWAQVGLSPVRKFTAYSMAWDSDKDELLVFLNDLTSGFVQKLVKVNTNFYPPSGSTLLNPGTIGNIGAVHGVAAIQDEDDEDYEIYIGGIFDYVGDGTEALNLVKFSKGSWEPVNSAPVKTLYAYGSTLYVGFLDPATNGASLPVTVINTQGDSNADQFTDLPVVIGGGGTVTCIYSDDEEVFVGGDFTVQLPNSGNTAHGVVVYSKKNQNWYGIGIPNTINSGGAGYLINSFTVNYINGSSILGIGGYFTFTTTDGFTYNSLALYNLDQDRWLPVNVALLSNTQISEVLLNNTGSMYLAGEFDVQFNSNLFGVANYNLNSGVLSEVGDLEDFVDGIVIYTDDKEREYLYAAGLLNSIPGTNNNTYGLAYAELTGSNQTWVPAGTDTVLYNCFLGTVSHLIYQTGGQGVNGTNGYDSSYSSGGGNGGGGGGGNGWWITLIVLAVLFVIIAVPVAGFAGWKYFGKRKNYYEEL